MTPISESNIRRLAELNGIEQSYHDIWGNEHRTTVLVMKRLLAAMRIKPKDDDDARHLIAEHEARTPSQRVAAADRCFLPEELVEGKLWGLSVQLYSIRSARSWGIGDFSDLKRLLTLAAQNGAAFVGLNPLHALFPNDPEKFSPYSPSTRRALNEIYIDVEAIPDFQESAEILALFRSEAMMRELAESRTGKFISYRTVLVLKEKFFRLAFEHFRLHHLATATERANSFRRFVESEGEALQSYISWTGEEEYRSYLQWLAHEQLSGCSEHARSLGMSIGLYLDLALGVDPEGADVRQNPELYALGASAGAPPDLLNVKGQSWGLPPMIPQKLREEGFRTFVETIRFNMRYAGALRIDHLIGYVHQFAVPDGMSGAEGAYITNPVEELLGIVAEESQRNECIVIGEDLGTVPPSLRESMRRWGVLSYKVLYFSKGENGEFLAPAEYARDSLVTTSTHDLPTLEGYLVGRDLEVRKGLGLFSEFCTYEGETAERARDRDRLVRFVEREGISFDVTEPGPPVHETLARAGSCLQSVQLEDILRMVDQVNLPGTMGEYQNWRRRLPKTLEEIESSGLLEATVDRFKSYRR